MSERQLTKALQAYLNVRDKTEPPPVSSFVCPYPNCGAYAAHTWGVVKILSAPAAGAQRGWTNRGLWPLQKLWAAQCSVCYHEVFFLDDALVWPIESQAPAPNTDMPASIASDFEEARQIYMTSPRGAAALLRLALQKLCGELGETGDINTAIGNLVAKGRISEVLQQALDSLRVIGNEAVHPGTLDLKDDQETALGLFKLLNFIVEKTISDPKRIADIYGKLPPEKLKGIADRDKKALSNARAIGTPAEETPAKE